MGSFSIWHILILGGAALLLFGGRGKISDFMGDFGKGLRSFKKGLVEEDSQEAPPGASRAGAISDAPTGASMGAPIPARAGEAN